MTGPGPRAPRAESRGVSTYCSHAVDTAGTLDQVDLRGWTDDGRVESKQRADDGEHKAQRIRKDGPGSGNTRTCGSDAHNLHTHNKILWSKSGCEGNEP